jgi:phospholipase D1/2
LKKRWLLPLLLLAALALAVRYLPILPWVVAAAKELHGRGALGALLTCAAIYAATLLFLPIIPLIIACGWLYGPWGALLSLPAAVASASTSFSVARALGRNAAARKLLQSPRARALAELAVQGGMVTVALVRLSPILPYTPSNAVLGLTGMRLRDLALGTALGMAPGIVLYSWAGSLLPSAEALERGAPPQQPGFVWVLFALAFAAAGILGVAAARRLKQQADAARPSGRPADRS